MPRYLLAAIAALLASSPAVGQQPVVRRLSDSGMLEHPETFTAIKGVAVLADGRVVVPDAAERRIVLLNFTTGSATPVGRAGAGPMEFQAPGAASVGRGGSVLVYDQERRRFLVVGAAGTLLQPLDAWTTEAGINITLRDPDQFTRDTMGGGVAHTSSLGPRGGRSSLRRIRPDGSSLPLAELRAQEVRTAGGTGPVRLAQLVEYSPADVWGAAPDGWVVIVQAKPYRTVWYHPDSQSPVMGDSIEYTPLRVAAEDRARAQETLRRSRPVTVTSRSGGTERTSTVATPDIEPLLAEVKPPFPLQILHTDRAGRVWVERTRVADGPTRYDVFDRSGRLTTRVEMPHEVALVGFDERHLYAVRRDTDDLLHLRRYRLP